jgi:hypothetical protein
VAEETKPCPLCNATVQFWERYPNAICQQCSSKTTDIGGDSVSYENESLSGGCEGFYTETEKPYLSEFCYVNGHKCIADEHRFGGIVIQLVRD